MELLMVGDIIDFQDEQAAKAYEHHYGSHSMPRLPGVVQAAGEARREGASRDQVIEIDGGSGRFQGILRVSSQYFKVIKKALRPGDLVVYQDRPQRIASVGQDGTVAFRSNIEKRVPQNEVQRI